MPDKYVYTARDGAFFVQRNTYTAPEYVGGYDIDDISADEGGIELIQQFDPNGDYETLGFTSEAPSPIEFSMTGWLGKTAEFLEQVSCPFFAHFNKRCGGIANLITNYDRAVVVKVLKKTNRTLSGLIMRNEQPQSEQSFDFSGAPPLLDVFKVTPDRQSTSEPRAANDIFFIETEICEGCNGPTREAGTFGAFSTDGAGGISADVVLTYDKGGTWTLAAADPFAVAENIQPIVGFWLASNVIRWLVGRGSTDAGNPAEVGYTDFNLDTDAVAGAAWTLANVGAVNAQFFTSKKTLHVYDRYNIWAATSGGYIYKSIDAGATWVAQEAGVLTASNLNVIRFVKGSKKTGFAAGAANALLRTLDGGDTWSALTAPAAQAAVAINALFAHDRYNIFIGYADGKFYRTVDGGLTWKRIADWANDGVGSVQDIVFFNEVVGYMLSNSAAPVGSYFFTRDCGVTWEALTNSSVNTGLNSLFVLRSNVAFAAGEVQAATAVILKTV